MNRIITAALLLTASSIPALAAAQSEPDLDAEEALDEEQYEEEEDYEGDDFCGGGDESVVDQAYYAMEDDRLEDAQEMLVSALREGSVERWQRGQALATLAEIQLRTGQYRPAVLNYRKALRIDPSGVTATARVGLATALFMRGAHDAAREEAALARDQVCADRWSMVACYGAHSLVVHTSRDAVERDAATETIAQLRASHADLGGSFDEVEQRLEGRRASAHRLVRS